jgi:hypothetical protein
MDEFNWAVQATKSWALAESCGQTTIGKFPEPDSEE